MKILMKYIPNLILSLILFKFSLSQFVKATEDCNNEFKYASYSTTCALKNVIIALSAHHQKEQYIWEICVEFLAFEHCLKFSWFEA